jgi:transcriptional pleiotropic regulator of transition state genes
MARKHAAQPNSGIVRAFDSLGRIVVPVEWRRALGLEEGIPAEITFTGDHIEI